MWRGLFKRRSGWESQREKRWDGGAHPCQRCSHARLTHSRLAPINRFPSPVGRPPFARAANKWFDAQHKDPGIEPSTTPSAAPHPQSRMRAPFSRNTAQYGYRSLWTRASHGGWYRLSWSHGSRRRVGGERSTLHASLPFTSIPLPPARKRELTIGCPRPVHQITESHQLWRIAVPQFVQCSDRGATGKEPLKSVTALYPGAINPFNLNSSCSHCIALSYLCCAYNESMTEEQGHRVS